MIDLGISSAALLVIAIVSFVITIGIEKSCIRLNLLDLPGARKMQKIPVPRMGGIVFFLLPLFISFFVDFHVSRSFFFSALIVFIGGWLDDLGLTQSAVLKISFQLPAAVLFAINYDWNNISVSSEWLIFYKIFLAGYIFFMINAANLMDNMNGLTSGIAIVSLAGLIFLAGQKSEASIYIPLMVVVLFTIFGFYLRNYPWGKIYMGDQGSQLIGYFMATITSLVLPCIYIKDSVFRPEVVTLLILVFSAIYILDVMTVVYIRIKERRPLWRGDQCHLSHQLVRRGLSPSLAVAVLTSVHGLIICLGCYLGFGLLV